MKYVRYFISALLLLLSILLLLPFPLLAADGSPVQGGFDVALVVADVSTPSVGCRAVRISWTTSDLATSQVFYDYYPHENIADYAYSTVENTIKVTEHEVFIHGLEERTTYHYRVRSVIPATDSEAISDDYTFATSRCSPHSESSTSYGYLEVNQFGEYRLFRISRLGESLNTIELISDDGRFIITIPEGTLCLDDRGRPLEYLEVEVCDSLPPLPSDCCLIGQALILGPDGSYFDPEIQITFVYDSSDMSDGVMERDLVIACCNENNMEWQFLQAEVDAGSNTVTANVGHLTTFALVGFPIQTQPEEEPSSSEPAISPPEETGDDTSSSLPESTETGSTPQVTTHIDWVILGPIIGVAVFIAIFIPLMVAKKRQAKIQ